MLTKGKLFWDIVKDKYILNYYAYVNLNKIKLISIKINHLFTYYKIAAVTNFK